MDHFFTRLTPNFKNWERPSGQDGKCRSSNASKPLYEELYHFGWEEWLFEDYHLNSNEPDFQCQGFIEAFNQKNRHKDRVDRIYLYTKVGTNNNRILPGYYYVGYIDNVMRIEPLPKKESDVQRDLKAAGISPDSFLPMLPFAKNISFKAKDVYVDFSLVFQQSIQLQRGQYRFASYYINKHSNFLTAINNYL